VSSRPVPLWMYPEGAHLTCAESSDSSSTRHSQAQRYSDACHVSWFPAPSSLLDLMDGLGRKEILEGMLGANLVCFQTYSYSRHFTSTCVRVCGHETTTRAALASLPANTSPTLSTNTPVSAHSDRSQSSSSSDNKYIGIDVQGHIVAVSHCPVGIDAERVARDTLRPGIQPKLESLRALYADKKIIVGRDKLDVVKGVLQKVCRYLGARFFFVFLLASDVLTAHMRYSSVRSRNYCMITPNGKVKSYSSR
jgi:hypothetical protein